MFDIALNDFQSNFEHSEHVSSDSDFSRYCITKFHVIEVDFYQSIIVRKIPLELIEKIYSDRKTSLYIVLKVGTKLRLTFSSEVECIQIEKYITDGIAMRKLKFEFDHLKHVIQFGASDIKMTDVDLYYGLLTEEFKRLQFDSEKWEIRNCNMDFELSPTYPRYHIVLRGLTENNLEKIAQFRSQRRFPTITFRSNKTGAILLRCGQPLIGSNGTRCMEDEDYLTILVKASQEPSKKMVIFDARPKEAAISYFGKGGGTEIHDSYSMAEHRFLHIPNMVTMWNYFEIWREKLYQNASNTVLKATDWVFYITRILGEMQQIADLLCREGRHVLIHCSNGWDRTPQFIATSKLIMDPFYRTCEGFKVLVEQEWRQMGHKFGERCATGSYPITRQYSPIFIQWLDCVYQLLCQFPQEFQFTQSFLVKLAIYLYIGVFGTFDRNFMKERCESDDKIVDIWSYLLSYNMKEFFNEDYCPAIEILYPKYSRDDIRIWTELYRYSFDNY